LDSLFSKLTHTITWDHIALFLRGRFYKFGETLTSRESLAALAGVAFVLAIEILVLGYAKSSFRRLLRPSQTARADLFFFLGKILGYNSFLIAFFSFGASVAVSRVANSYFHLDLVARIDNGALRLLVFFLVTDFADYWVHRLRHTWGWWWELHKHHHAAEELNVITTARGHPLDMAAASIFKAIPMALLGGTLEEYLLILLALGIHAGLTHSMLEWRFGWVGKYLIFSPVGHRIHHSPLPEHMNKNFGSLFPIWDRIFGSFYTGHVLNDEVGVDDNYMNKRGLFWDMFECARRTWRAALGQSPALQTKIDTKMAS